MQVIDQHAKGLMEGCKERAQRAGLKFSQETLEYIVTNKDLIELTPKYMIPTLYDFWIQEVEVLKGKRIYDLYPSNPFETVINTRPPISFYNDNNPDWMNVMIFYHVLAHIDFFQNNLYYQRTWQDDFKEQARIQKRRINKLRSEHGRWVDYVIEFGRQLDNLFTYYRELSDEVQKTSSPNRFDYYFDVFLQEKKNLSNIDYQKEIDEYNYYIRQYDDEKERERFFFQDVAKRYPELEECFQKYCQEEDKTFNNNEDPLKFILDNSPKINNWENKWMKEVLEIIRETSLFLAPQLRTKIINEGWASYWHEKLFMEDDRIRGHEADFAKINAKVTAMSQDKLNPYALGKKLWEYVEHLIERGKNTWEFEQIRDITDRENYQARTGSKEKDIFTYREELNDFSFLNKFLTQDFVNQERLFVSERRYNRGKRVWEVFIKSRKAEDYWRMIKDNHLPHPPSVQAQELGDKTLKLTHIFEGRPLFQQYIPGVLVGAEFLWGYPIILETHEVSADSSPEEIKWNKVFYMIQNGKIRKTQ